MIRLAVALIFGLLIIPSVADAGRPQMGDPPAIDWRLVARSQLIVGGEPMTVTIGDAAAKQIGPGYVAWRLAQPVYVKGGPRAQPPTIFLTEHTSAALKGEINAVPGSVGGRYFFFLTELPQRPELGYVLTEGDLGSSIFPDAYGAPGLSLFILEHVLTNIHAELSWQENVRAFMDTSLAVGPRDNERQIKVKEFLVKISSAPAEPQRQKALLRQLTAPSDDPLYLPGENLIAYMENWQLFPAGSLTLEVTSGDGSVRDVTLKPELMVDAIDAILAQIGYLGVERRFLSDNPSDDARVNAIRAWRVHASRSSMGAAFDRLRK